MMKSTSFSWPLVPTIILLQIIHALQANWITGNLCWSMPCMNGGSCFGSAYTYLCVCPINFSGALCEKRLGICQENPCGNRGLCVETGVTSFECRCYFDYMGPLCEEHVPKNDPTVWSSLIPVHTRVLLDFLQEAYRAKAQGKAQGISSDSSTHSASSSHMMSTSTIPVEPVPTRPTYPRETTEPEHVIVAENIQLEKIFPEISTTSESVTDSVDTSVITSIPPTMELSVTDAMTMDTTMITVEDTSSTLTTPETTLASDTVIPDEPVTTETVQTTIQSTTELRSTTNSTETASASTITTSTIPVSTTTTTITKVPSTTGSTSTLAKTTMPNTTEVIIETTSMAINSTWNETEFDQLFTNITAALTDDPSTTFEPTTLVSSSETDSTEVFSSSEISSTSVVSTSATSVTTDSPVPVEDLLHALNKSESLRNRLLYKLCRQLLSHIFPNNSTTSVNASESAMSLTSNSSLMMNHTATALLSWIHEQLNASTATTMSTSVIPTTTVPTTTSPPPPTTTTTMIPSSSVVIQGRKLGLNSLQRINMDEALAWANDPFDGEH